MNILNLILTTISLVLSIISDIIAIKSKRKIEMMNSHFDIEITQVTKKTEYIEKRYKLKNKFENSEKFMKST